MSELHQACRNGDLEKVRALVAVSPEAVNSDDEHEWRPIFHSALHKRLEVTRFLLEQGADVAAHDGYVLHYAAEVPGNQPIVTMLL